MIKAVIFDLDGLMIDSEQIQSKAFEEVIREYGRKPVAGQQGIVHKPGFGSDDNWKILKEKYNIQEEIEVLRNKRRKIYRKLLQRNIKPYPGLIQLLKQLKEISIKTAIASSSTLAHILLVIDKLNIKSLIDAIVSRDEVKRGKPDPEIFLKASKKLKIKPDECLVLEDTEVGVLAAKKANMKIFAIPNIYTRDHDFSQADSVFKSLKEMNSIILNSK